MNGNCPIQPELGINDIVIDSKSAKWLEQNEMMPIRWRISAEEQSRITSMGLGLRVTFSPVFAYDFSDHKVGKGKVIFFDFSMVERRLIEREEAIAFLLHEVGHSVNKYRFTNRVGSPELYCEQKERKNKPELDEYDADDYARHCGYGEALMTGIQKMIDQPGFDLPVNHERICRIRNKAEIQRHF